MGEVDGTFAHDDFGRQTGFSPQYVNYLMAEPASCAEHLDFSPLSHLGWSCIGFRLSFCEATILGIECPLCAKSGLMQCSKKGLFDHLVGELQEMLGNVEPKRFCGLEVDDKLKLDWRLCGEFGRLLALQNTIDI